MKDTYATEDLECVADLTGPIQDLAGNAWLLTSIRTFPKYRNKGFARKLLREICADADREGVTLYLSVVAEEWDNQRKPGLNQTQLTAFYEHHGFRRFNYDPSAMRR